MATETAGDSISGHLSEHFDFKVRYVHIWHVLDKSKTNSSGFVLDLSKTCPSVASADTDLSVSGMS